MMKITITHEDGVPHTYENVVGVDFIDRENCENVAGRELTEKELSGIEHAISNCEYFPTQDDLRIIVREIMEKQK